MVALLQFLRHHRKVFGEVHLLELFYSSDE